MIKGPKNREIILDYLSRPLLEGGRRVRIRETEIGKCYTAGSKVRGWGHESRNMRVRGLKKLEKAREWILL